MDDKDHKDTEATEAKVDTSVEIEDGDLDTVTGGMIHIGGAGPTDPTDPCITSIG